MAFGGFKLAFGGFPWLLVALVFSIKALPELRLCGFDE
jgi:hypothetical protein